MRSGIRWRVDEALTLGAEGVEVIPEKMFYEAGCLTAEEITHIVDGGKLHE